jgi:hypothetical protein
MGRTEQRRIATIVFIYGTGKRTSTKKIINHPRLPTFVHPRLPTFERLATFRQQYAAQLKARQQKK